MIIDNEQLVPDLRFSEFEGEWSKSLISSLLKIGSGKDYKHLNTGDIPVYGTGGYMTSVDEYLHDGESVCIGRKGTIDKPMFLKGKFWTVDTLFFTHSYQQNIPKFLYLIFQRINWKKYNEASGVPSLSKKTIEKIKIVVPKPKEQQKIANFLTAIDQRITLLKDKKAALEQYKIGLMQKIFSQEIRFVNDEGNEFPDWEEKRLGDVLTIGSGKDYKHLNEGDIPVYGTGGYMTSVNELLYEGDSVGIGRKGTIDKPMLLSGRFWTVDTLFYTHSFKKVTPFFVYLLFQTINWKKYNEASGVPSLSKTTIEKIKVKIPEIEEQQKIADCLSAIDQSINQLTKQIDQSTQFKKGLLQRMFV